MKKGLFLLCLMFSSFCNGQLDTGFVNYLSEQELQNEHWTYLNSFPNTDSLAYYKTKFALQYEELNLLEKSIQTCRSLVYNDTLLLNEISLFYLSSGESKYASNWFHSIESDSVCEITKSLTFLYKIACLDELPDSVFIPEVFMEPWGKYQHIKSKKKSTAILCSIIPGMGELYIGKRKSFLIEFLSTSVMGLQIVETVSKGAVLSPLLVVDLSLFALFYGSNFVGVLHDLKREIQHQRLNFLNYVWEYYAHLSADPAL
jgi:hypothetical protein